MKTTEELKELAFDIIKVVSPEDYRNILFRDNYRDQPWKKDNLVNEIAEMIRNENY